MALHLTPTPPMMTCELFYRSTVALSRPATDYVAVRGATGAGVTGNYAVSVTENVYRGAYCETCDATSCRHIDAVRLARAAGDLPPLDTAAPHRSDSALAHAGAAA